MMSLLEKIRFISIIWVIGIDMDKLELTIDIFLPLLALIVIIALLVGITIKINKLMVGTKINFLENKKLVFVFALFLIFLYLCAILFGYLEGFVYYWYDYLSFSFLIALIFAAGKYTPSLIVFLRELHQGNLEDAKEQESQKSE